MMMKMLESGGLTIMADHIREADIDNPKGYYELERVKELDKQTDKSWMAKGRGKVVKVISQLLRHLPRENDYLVLFMHRDLQEVMASQNKMLKRRGEPINAEAEAEMVEMFQDHLRRVRVWFRHQPNIEVLNIHYGKVLKEPLSESKRIVRFIGGGLDAQAMATIVDPQLYRNRAE
jgi:hypothetical protein